MKTKVATINNLPTQYYCKRNRWIVYEKRKNKKYCQFILEHKNQKIFIAFVDIFQLTEEL